jgi:hypothetical protein
VRQIMEGMSQPRLPALASPTNIGIGSRSTKPRSRANYGPNRLGAAKTALFAQQNMLRPF